MNSSGVKENLSLQLINFNDQLFPKLLINICTLFSVSFAVIISLSIIVYVFVTYNLRKNTKNSASIPLLLSCNTCLAVICSSIVHILMQLSNISGDRDVVCLKWIILWGCYLRGYLLFVFINSIYLSYVLQAAYRLFRIVFYQHRYRQTALIYPYYILALWIICFITILPILFTGENLTTSIVYLPEDFYCQVPVSNIYMMIYLVSIVYLSPLLCLSTIYVWIIIYVRRNTRRQQTISISRLRRRNNRDSVIIKRICVVVFSLFIPVFASVIFFMVFVITGHFHWAFYRLNGMTIAISYAFICLSSLYITPEIFNPTRTLVRSSRRHERHPQDSISVSRTTRTPTETSYSLGRVSSNWI